MHQVYFYRVAFAALVSLSILWLSASPLSAETAWQQKRVRVFDFSPATWTDVIQESVNDLQGIIPRHGPRFRYVRREALPCGQTPKTTRAIVVCLDAGEACGNTEVWSNDGAILRAILHLEPEANVERFDWGRIGREKFILHELSHAILDSSERVANWTPELTNAMRRHAKRLYSGDWHDKSNHRKHHKHHR